METPSILSHVSVGVTDLSRSVRFYNEVLATLDVGIVFEEQGVPAVAYGRQFPEFWVQTPYNGEPPSVGNGYHIAFIASSKQQVHDFYEAAINMGAEDDGKPGLRPQYSDAYYGCFVRDPDGHKIEAMFWDEECSSH